MSSPVQQSPEKENATPEHSATVDRPQSGFTAMNGRSPSTASSSVRESSEHARRPSGVPHRDSQVSPGKRKDSNTPSSPSMEQTLKKQRTSDSQEHTPTMQPPSEVFPPDSSRESPDIRSERNPSDASWAMHERNGSINSDAHLAEVLHNNITAGQMGHGDVRHDHRYPLDPEHPHQYPGPPGIQMQTPPSMSSSHSHKQRKRNFSNRTKTGCLTCRERKKKCDELKPECANCQRGGFFCKGYVQSNSTQFKSAIPRDQPTLQAKNGYYDHQNQYRYPLQPTPYYDSAAPPDGRRPPTGDEAREHPRPMPQPQEPTLRPGYPPQQWPEQQQQQPQQQPPPPPPPQPQPQPQHQQPTQHYRRDSASRQDYQQVPPLRDLPHQQKQINHPPPAPIHPPHNRSMSQHGPPQNGAPPQYQRNQPASYTNPRLLAMSALEHQNQQAYVDEHLSEKQKMLKGFSFDRHNAKLKQERYDCATAIYRFNKNAIEPGNLSEPSRREQFRQILEGSKSDGSPNNRKRRSISPQSERVMGHLGLRVEVEAPFYCEYGYNINIGDDVEIGPNVRIMDSCHVEIGARCMIGPDVKILTLDGDHHVYNPPGKKRNCKAKRIVIGEDVFIGAGAIILPGISIHKGATIGAGCVVSRDVTSPVSVVPGTYPRYTKTHYYGAP